MSQCTLLFYPDTLDGRMLHLDRWSGTPVKAGLGILDAGTHQIPWLDLFDIRYGRHLRHRARDANVRYMASCVAPLAAAGFYERTRYKDFELGRTIFDGALHRVERALHLLMQIDAFRRHHGFERFATWRADELPADAREALATYAAARSVTFEPLDAPPIEVVAAPAAPLYGHYDWYGALGREIASIRPGTRKGFDDVPFEWGYCDFNRARLPLKVPLRAAASSVGLVLRLLYAYADKGTAVITLATAERESVITIEPDGVFDRTVDPPIRLAPPPGPMELSFIAWIDGETASFGRHGDRCHALRTRRRRVEALGIAIDCADAAGPLLRFAEVTVLTDLDAATLVRRSRGLAASAIDAGASVDVDGSRQAPATSRQTIGNVMVAGNHAVENLPGIGWQAAPIYFDGYVEALRAAGFGTRTFFTGSPWHLGGPPTASDASKFVLDAANSPAETTEAIDRFAKSMSEDLKLMLGTMSWPALPPHASGLEGICLGGLLSRCLIESTQWASWYCGQYEKARTALQQNPVDALVGPRLDSAHLPVAAAARSLGTKTASLEISFLFHEHQRLHRLAGVDETVDAIVYWGTAAHERLREMGLPTGGTHVAGLHVLDHCAAIRRLRANPPGDRGAYWAGLGVPGVEGPVVLFVAHFGGRQAIVDVDKYRSTAKTIIEALGKAGRGTLIIKSLTTDDPRVIGSVLADLPQARLRVLSPFHPFQNGQYLLGSDLVLGSPTTMLVEAVAAGVAAFTLDYANHESWYPVSHLHMERLGRIAPVLTGLPEVAAVVADTIAHGAPSLTPDEAALSQMFGAIDGGNLERVLQLLGRQGVIASP